MFLVGLRRDPHFNKQYVSTVRGLNGKAETCQTFGELLFLSLFRSLI